MIDEARSLTHSTRDYKERVFGICLALFLVWQLAGATFDTWHEVRARPPLADRFGRTEEERIAANLGQHYSMFVTIREAMPPTAYLACQINGNSGDVAMAMKQLLYPRIMLTKADLAERLRTNQISIDRRVFLLYLQPPDPAPELDGVTMLVAGDGFALYEWEWRK